MKELMKAKKVIWAVDPFLKGNALQLGVARSLREFVSEGGAGATEIEPVFVLNASPLLADPSLLDEYVRDMEVKAERVLQPVVKQAKLKGLLPVRILVDSFSGLQAEVSALLQHAEAEKAELIAVSTHARKGLKRWLMGSFAETLMLSSRIPLWVVNPQGNAHGSLNFKKVLFPTDFSPESKTAFGRLLEMLAPRQGRVTLFRYAPFLGGAELKRMVSVNPEYRKMYHHILAQQEAEGRAWVEFARQKGVNAKVVIENRAKGSTAKAVLDYAVNHPGVIAMAARSGKLMSALLGSTTRQVLRAATTPVWVIHVKGKLPKRVRAGNARDSRDSRVVL